MCEKNLIEMLSSIDDLYQDILDCVPDYVSIRGFGLQSCTSFQRVVDYVRQEVYNEPLMRCTAMEYLQEGTNLDDALKAAADRGYSLECVDTFKLASMLKADRAEEHLYTKRAFIEDRLEQIAELRKGECDD